MPCYDIASLSLSFSLSLSLRLNSFGCPPQLQDRHFVGACFSTLLDWRYVKRMVVDIHFQIHRLVCMIPRQVLAWRYVDRMLVHHLFVSTFTISAETLRDLCAKTLSAMLFTSPCMAVCQEGGCKHCLPRAPFAPRILNPHIEGHFICACFLTVLAWRYVKRMVKSDIFQVNCLP